MPWSTFVRFNCCEHAAYQGSDACPRRSSALARFGRARQRAYLAAAERLAAVVGTVLGSPRRTGLLFTAVAAGGAAVVAIGLVLVVLATTLDGQRNSNARVRRSELVLRTASDAERAVVDAETGLRGYVITTDPAFLAPYRTG